MVTITRAVEASFDASKEAFVQSLAPSEGKYFQRQISKQSGAMCLGNSLAFLLRTNASTMCSRYASVLH